MPDLLQSLQGRDLGHLRIVAERWGLSELWSGPDARIGLQRLAPLLLNRQRLLAVVADLPAEARQALEALQANGGRLTWALFVKRYGLVREMGPAKRDRERPDLSPVSPAEMLWYRGLAGQAFLKEEREPEQYAYIPDDLLALLPMAAADQGRLFGRPATPLERALVLPASDRILDEACNLLAALRLGLYLDKVKLSSEPAGQPYALTPAALLQILGAAGLVGADKLPLPEPTRQFLESPRGEAMALLVRAWLSSPDLNELHLLSGLSMEGEWKNDPLRTRQAVLTFLGMLPLRETKPQGSPAAQDQPFWNLASFVAGVKQEQPDFQRPAGDYDSWYICAAGSAEFLRGFEHWDRVDGELLQFMVCGPLHWLGLVDLAAPGAGQPPLAFRISPWAAGLLRGAGPPGLPAEDGRLQVRSDGRVLAGWRVSRAVRYQIARFCAWEEAGQDGYHYRLTPASLALARQQGLRLGHLLSLLRRHAPGVPPPLARALERWEEHGLEARLEQAVILRVSSPEVLQALRSSRAARFLGDPLGPTTVIVQAGAEQKVLSALLELGYLGDGLKKSPE